MDSGVIFIIIQLIFLDGILSLDNAAVLGATLALSRVRWLEPINAIWRPVLWLCALLLYPIEWLTWPFRALLRALSGARRVGHP